MLNLNQTIIIITTKKTKKNKVLSDNENTLMKNVNAKKHENIKILN